MTLQGEQSPVEITKYVGQIKFSTHQILQLFQYSLKLLWHNPPRNLTAKLLAICCLQCIKQHIVSVSGLNPGVSVVCIV